MWLARRGVAPTLAVTVVEPAARGAILVQYECRVPSHLASIGRDDRHFPDLLHSFARPVNAVARIGNVTATLFRFATFAPDIQAECHHKLPQGRNEDHVWKQGVGARLTAGHHRRVFAAQTRLGKTVRVVFYPRAGLQRVGCRTARHANLHAATIHTLVRRVVSVKELTLRLRKNPRFTYALIAATIAILRHLAGQDPAPLCKCRAVINRHGQRHRAVKSRYPVPDGLHPFLIFGMVERQQFALLGLHGGVDASIAVVKFARLAFVENLGGFGELPQRRPFEQKR